MKYHTEKSDNVVSYLRSDISRGLSREDISDRQLKYGENKLNKKKKKTNFQRFIDQFKDVMILILIAAALISFAVACMEGEAKDFFEPVLILMIVVMNALMGVMQESKAERALQALKSLSAPHARVIRDGEEKIISAEELVPGDIIRLEAGDFVPADARLLRSTSLKCEESALTGESVPAEKDGDCIVEEQAALGDRCNMVFSGCSVTYGTGTAIVIAIGMDTEMGKIANLLENEEEMQTPLQKKLAQLGKYLGFLAIAACVVIFMVGILNGIRVKDIFMTAVSLAVSAIPEGLPAIVTIVLAIGVQQMAKRNAIVRRLPAVETLGSASVICSDKTGTLTQNRMTLVKAFCCDTGKMQEIGTENSADVKELLKYGTLCCDGSVTFCDGKEQHIGDPTETAIVLAAYKNGMSKEDLNKEYPRIAELPFDSERKLMSTINRIDGKNMVIVKGAFDVLALRCSAGDIQKAREMTETMSSQALRVLAIACKEINEIPKKLTPKVLECNLTMLGLVGMIDPPRPEAKTAVEVCRKAGIKPVMITGDHVITASAIAKQLGIMEERDKAITGVELDAMTDSQLDKQVGQIAVYARVSPENKIRIVKAWQRNGHVVSMTGDGVNDAPALKAADIGCAMGITGTDVAKGAADMTLTDDNFATIVDAIREGRGIYANIKRVVGYLLGTNIGEVIVVFLAMIFWHKSPFMSMQLLWINLVTDSLPAIALGMEPVDEHIMNQKPKHKDENFFAHGFGIRIALQGIMFGLLALIAFRIGENVTGRLEGGQTLAFMVLALSQIIQAFNMRSERSLFQTGAFGNKALNKAAVISAFLVVVVLFTPLSVPFGLIMLPIKLYAIGIGMLLVPIVVMEITKAHWNVSHMRT